MSTERQSAGWRPGFYSLDANGRPIEIFAFCDIDCRERFQPPPDVERMVSGEVRSATFPRDRMICATCYLDLE